MDQNFGKLSMQTIPSDLVGRSPEQVMQSKRLFHILQQQFMGYSKRENLIRSRISATGITESNGFELLRVIRKEFSLARDVFEVPCEENRASFGHHPGS